MKCPYCDGTGEIANPTLGTCLTMARKRAGLTQLELAQAVLLSRGQIANIETDRTDIPVKTLLRLADALGCSVKDLLP